PHEAYTLATTRVTRPRRSLEEQSHELVRVRASFNAATRVLVPSFSNQPVNLPQEDRAFVPSHPILPAMIGGAPSSVGVEEGWPHGPEVPQFPRLADRDSAQLHEEVTQIQGWVPSRTLIKIEHDDFPASPEKIRGPEVTVHEREMWGESWRLIHDLSEGSSQTWRLA